MFPDDARQHLNQPRYGFVDVEDRRIEELLAAEGEQLARQRGRAVGRFPDLPHIVRRPLVGLDPLEDQVGEADDGGEQVVEVVSDAAGQPADAFHLLRVPELILPIAKDAAGVPVAHRVADRALEVRREHVLLDVVGGALVQRRLVERAAAVPGHEDERLGDARLLRLVDEVDAGAVGQPVIDEVEVVVVGLDPFEPGCDGRRDLDARARSARP